MAKALADIRSLARSHTETALNVLAGIMCEKTSPAAARVAAAEALLNRGWGKAPQAVTGENGEGPAELLIRWLTAPQSKS